ncbi:MAG: SAM-dependent methyltransferase [Anaerolineales bacterium]|jgi:methyltransferase (TIGR00027 family)
MVVISSINASLGSTARWTAAARAYESEREDHLFEDPWASKLAGIEGAAWAATRTPDSLAPMILRIRYFDDFLQRVTREDAIHQVVLMAAGYDTRAYRLTWPAGTIVFELDQPAVLRDKERVLHSSRARPNCERQTLEVDLTDSWDRTLTEAGFKPKEPAVWLLEGFLFYIPSGSISHLLDEVNGLSSSGSWLGFDIINSSTLVSPYTHSWIEMQEKCGAPWIGTMDDPSSFLTMRGWKTALTQAGAPDANHGRWHLPVIPVAMPGMPHNWFVTAKKGNN